MRAASCLVHALLFLAATGLGSAWAQEAGDDEPATATLPEVRVVDEPLGAASDKAYAATVLKREEFSAPGLSLADVLDAQAGAEVVRRGDGMAYASVSLRGTSSEQVALILDDIPLVSVLGGALDLSHLPLAALGRLTLIRGATPSRYGASGMAGALVLETRHPKRRFLSLHWGAGSFAERSAGLLYSDAKGAASWLLSADYAGQNGAFPYRNDNGTRGTTHDDFNTTRQNNDADQFNVLLKGQLRLGSEWTLKTLDWLFFRAQGVSGSGPISAEKTRLRSLENLLALQAAGPLGSSALRSRTRLSLQLADSRLGDSAAELGFGAQKTRDLSLSPALHQALEIRYTPSLSQVVQIGYRYDWFTPYGEARPKRAGSARHLLTAGSELLARLGASGLSLQAEGELAFARSRFTARFTESVGQNNAQQTSDWQGAGRLALVAEGLKDTRFYLACGRAFRLPSLSELFGNQGLVLGNTQLRPETRLAYEMGGSYDPVFGQGLAALHLALGGYLNDYRDLISYTQNAQGLSRPENLDRARLFGLEAELSADLFAHLILSGNYSWLHARNESPLAARSGRALALRAAHKASARAEVYARGLSADWTRVALYSTYGYSSAHYLDAANMKRVPAAQCADLGFRVELFHDAVHLDGRVSNVGDARTYDLIGLPLPGRAVHFSAEWRWN